MVKKLREEYRDKVRLVLIDDYTVTSFDPENAVYKEQLQKGLSMNIFVKVSYFKSSLIFSELCVRISF